MIHEKAEPLPRQSKDHLVSVMVVSEDRRNILIISRLGKDKELQYHFPGGFVRKEETCADAAKRHLRKRLGLPVRLEDLFQIYCSIPDGRAVEVFFVFGCERRPILKQAAHEGEAIWVPKADLLSGAAYPVNPTYQSVILNGCMYLATHRPLL